MSRALRVEWWKLRTSPVGLVATALMGGLLPAMGLGFYTVAVSGGEGAMADKAAAMLDGEGWGAYLGLVDQIVAIAIFVGAGVVVAWVFGREHTDRTFPALFSLPVARTSIAASKFVVLGGWSIVLATSVTVVSVVLGSVSGVGSVADAGDEVWRLFQIAVGASGLAMTMGYVASVGRGYLPAIGVIFVVVAVTQVAVLFGTGAWLPFAVPGLTAVGGSDGIPYPSPLQWAMVGVVIAAAVAATLRWWRRAEVV